MSERDRLKLKQLQARLAQEKPEKPKVGKVGGAAGAASDGALLGFGDEYLAGLSAVAGLQPDGQGGANWFQYDKPLGQRYDAALGAIREEQAQFKGENPKTALAAEVVGSLAVPAGKVASVGQAAVRGAQAGGAYAFGEGEGGLVDRAKDAPMGAVTGLLFGGTLAGVQKGVSASITRMFNKAAKRPTVEGLKATKNAAYQAVDQSGEVFTPAEVKGVYDKVVTALDDTGYVPEVDRQTYAALKILEKGSERNMTLSQLDKIRQGLWKRYGAANNEVGILDAIGAIDDLIDTRAGSSAVMDTARAANAKFSKATLLEDAFNKARLQTESTGSGGNILNKYRQAVTAIVTNPKKAKWFSGEEIALMEKFVEGDLPQNVMRRIGKLAPGGNGLMQALNLVAASIDPTFIAASGAAQASKVFADRAGMRGAERLQDAVSTGIIPRQTPKNYGRAAVTGGALSN